MQITSFTIVYSTVYSGRSKKTPKLCVTGLCVGNSLVTGEFPTQRANNMENVPIWWCHHIQTTKTVIISLYLQATWSKNDISLVHEISFIYLIFFIIETEKSGHQCDHDHAVSANRILWVYAGFWWYHGILLVHLQDSVGAFGAKWLTKWLHHAKAPPRRGVLRWEWSNKDVHLVTTFVFCHVSKC